MAKLEEYLNLEEKSNFYNCETGMLCGQLDLLFYKLQELFDSGKYIFRGVNNARYKLYNSAQREFLKRELLFIDKFKSIEERYNNWIVEILKYIKSWNNNSLQDYFENIGISKDDDISFLCHLQHNGFPTPLIDFTFDPFVALYFATEDVDYNTSELSIDSCFSLYYLDRTTYLNQVLNIDYPSSIKKDFNNYSDLIQFKAITLIDYNSKNHKVITNNNIINQKGCSVFNWHSVNPLEISYSNLIKELNARFSQHTDHVLLNDKINCLNIHKSLIPKIIYELQQRKHINKEYIYPNILLDKKSIIDNSIINLLK